jgi:RNA polymerase sigma-70 factor (ECF subfamily)
LRSLHNLYLTNGRAKSGRHTTTPLVDTIDSQEERDSLKPEAAFESREVCAAVASLPEALRAVLVAVDIAGLSYREAAKALSVPEGTVMSRLYRARRQVGRRLQP